MGIKLAASLFTFMDYVIKKYFVLMFSNVNTRRYFRFIGIARILSLSHNYSPLYSSYYIKAYLAADSELLGSQKAPPLPQMADVKTAAELEATIKQRIGLQRPDEQPQSSTSSQLYAHPRTISPPQSQPQQSAEPGEMSAFKKFVSFFYKKITQCHLVFCGVLLRFDF